MAESSFPMKNYESEEYDESGDSSTIGVNLQIDQILEGGARRLEDIIGSLVTCLQQGCNKRLLES